MTPARSAALYPQRPVAAGPDSGRSRIPMLFSARTFAEYVAMFSITEAELGMRLLDCPGGSGAFAASLGALGGRVTSIDPFYADPMKAIGARANDDARRASRYVESSTDRYTFGFWSSPAAHRSARHDAATTFSADLAAHPGRYVAGALPALPFRDNQFEMVLSGHLLFTYADRFDFAFHMRALVELARVASREVRVFPVCDLSLRRYARLDSLRGRLSRVHGVETELRSVDYEVQRGATQMLVCHETT